MRRWFWLLLPVRVLPLESWCEAYECRHMELFGNCEVDLLRGSGGGDNTVAFASCAAHSRPLAIRVGLVKPSR